MGCGSSITLPGGDSAVVPPRSYSSAVASSASPPAAVDPGAVKAKPKGMAGKIVGALLTKQNADTLADEVYTAAEAAGLNDKVAAAVATAEQVEDAVACFKDVVVTGLVDAGDAMLDVLDAFTQLPMVGAAFAVAGKIFHRAKDVQVNKYNCHLLEKLVRRATMFLKAAMLRDKAHGYSHLSDAEVEISDLHEYLTKADLLIDRYAGSDAGSWLLMFVSAPRDLRRFEQLTQLITGTLDQLKDVALMQLVSAAGPLLPPSHALPTAADFLPHLLAAAARVKELSGEADIAAGLKKLAKTDPEGLQEVAYILSQQPDGAPSPDAVAAAASGNAAVLKTLQASERLLEQLGERVEAVHRDVLRVECAVEAMHEDMTNEFREMKGLLAQLLSKRDAQDATAPLALPTYMEEWWNTAVGRLKENIANSDLLEKVVKWFKKERLQELLASYDEELEDRKLLGQIIDASGVDNHVFLSVVLIHELLDHNHSGTVTRLELRQLELKAIEFAKAVARESPHSMLEIFDVIFLGYNWNTFLGAAKAAPGSAVAVVTSTLKMESVIKSYNTQELVKEYQSNSRQWLFDEVNTWLFQSAGTGATGDSLRAPAVTQPAPPERALQDARMFLMLADAGMGKSVFSAVMDTKLVVRANTETSMKMVRHFFKVGQERAQGKVMILSLAEQLAVQVPGFAELLAPTALQIPDTTPLTLTDTFNLFLMQPLTELDEKARSVSAKWHRPGVVLLLLDALDEADHGGLGYEPVTRLIAHEFVRLPPWVKVMLTGRPQIESHFTAWKPEWITPDNDHNKRDMLELLRWRLEKHNHVAIRDLEAATQLMWLKSKGQFIYVKYAFDELGGRTTVWTLPELQAHLSDGLGSMFQRVLDEMHRALMQEQLTLLNHRLLPVLVVARDLLTVAELVWATGGDADQVHLLLRLLGNLFPCSASSNPGVLHLERPGVVRPYHKSVLDWLTGADSLDAGRFKVDSLQGHRCLAQACRGWATLHEQPRAKVEHQGPQRSAAPAAAAAATAGAGATQHAAAAAVPDARDGRTYALRHSVAHACLALDARVLEDTLHDLKLWEAVFAAGFGPAVLVDLMQLSAKVLPESVDMVADMLRWLRGSQAFLVKHPRAAWQLACDAPHNSLLAKHAAGLPHQPPARLLNKEEEWPACLATLVQHNAAVTGMAISADGKTIVSGSEDMTLRVWDLASGQCRNTLEGHTAAMRGVAISADSTLIFSASEDKTVRMWDLATGECKRTLAGHTDVVRSVACSRDGKLLVSGSYDKTVRVWDLASGLCTLTCEGHTNYVTAVAISPDGLFAASGAEDNTVRVWDLTRGQCTSTLEGHTDWVRSVAISPDSKFGVSGAYDKTVRVWDFASGSCTQTLIGHTGWVLSTNITPDGTTVVSGAEDKTIRVWDLASGLCTTLLEGHTDWVRCVAISPDGKTIASGSDDMAVRVWDLASGLRKSTLETNMGEVRSAAITPDRQTVVSGSENKLIRVWDLSTGRCTRTIEGHTGDVMSVAISPDGTRVVSASWDKTVRVWDLLTGLCTSTLEGHTSVVTCVAVSPDGKTIVSSSCDKTVRVWDFASGQCRSTLEGHTGDVMTVAISPDSKTIVSDSYGDVRLWDLALGKALEDVTEAGALELKLASKTWAKFPPQMDELQLSAQSDKGEVVEVLALGAASQQPHTATAAIAVFVLPPFVASGELGMHVGSGGKSLVVFDRTSSRVLCYRLT